MSERFLWAIVVILCVPALAVLTSLIPLQISEPTPVVKSFTIYFPNNTAQIVKPSDEIVIPAGNQVMVEAEQIRPAAVHCAWSAMKGILLPADGCAIHYHVPLVGDVDLLNLHVQSACKTKEVFSSLHIRVEHLP